VEEEMTSSTMTPTTTITTIEEDRMMEPTEKKEGEEPIQEPELAEKQQEILKIPQEKERLEQPYLLSEDLEKRRLMEVIQHKEEQLMKMHQQMTTMSHLIQELRTNTIREQSLDSNKV
jgi:hypothetical protein